MLSIVDLRGQLKTHPTKSYERRALSDITRLIIHHAGVHPNVGPWAFAEYHVIVKQWPGIGYHYTAAVEGTIYQTNDLEVISYHAAGHNADSVGICLHGDWTEGRNPPGSQLKAVGQLIHHIEQQLGRSLAIVGHQEMGSTQCPGDGWQSWRWELIDNVDGPDYEQLYNEAQGKLELIRQLLC